MGMMTKRNARRSTCPINASLEVIGDRWSLLIVRDMLFGRARTYKDFRGAEEGIATNILADRLERLLSFGIIASEQAPDDGRRMIYRLTEKGFDLVPVLMELSFWGSRYEEGRPPPGILEEWQSDKEAFVERVRARSHTAK